MGDFNYPDIQWDIESSGCAKSCKLLSTIQDNFLSQMIDEPTRRNSFLDLVLSNRPDIISDLQVREHLGTSDHNMMEAQYSMDQFDDSLPDAQQLDDLMECIVSDVFVRAINDDVGAGVTAEVVTDANTTAGVSDANLQQPMSDEFMDFDLDPLLLSAMEREVNAIFAA
ncbi:uncharacterized protein ACNLHF_022386 [Anomaloglossus baeobatrachus]